MVRRNQTRKFNGENFRIVTAHPDKHTAKRYAESRRKRGDKVRVTPETIDGKKVHGIWVRGR